MQPLRHFDNLDALRFLAFFSVFCLHMVSFGLYYNGEAWYRWIEESLLLNGDLGVNFFFTLSGFLITNLLLQEREDTGKISVGNFYIRRFLRIWPLYFVLVAVGFIVIPSILSAFPQANPFKPEFSLIPYDRLVYYLSFLVNYDLTVNPYPSPVLAVLWSISVEEQFYIFWPLLIAFIPRKYLIYSLFGVLAATFLFRFMQWTEIASLFNTYQLGNVDVPHPADVVARFETLRRKATMITRFHTFSILSDITMGALLAYGLFYSERLRMYFKNLPTKSIVLPYLLAIMLVIIREETYSLRFYSIIPLVHAFEPMLFSFVFAFIIGEQHYSDHSFFRFGKLKLMSEFGKYSYGMYIWHLVVIWLVFFAFQLFHLQPDVDNPWVFLAQIILCFTITLFVAKLSYHIIEAPFLKLRNRFRSRAGADHFMKGEMPD
jgi:peptidoglycan/LPS O-acetylase OafA/YrhL